MLADELMRLVDDCIAKRCETQNIEFKKAAGGTPQRIYDTLSAFSNRIGGGIIIFGIDQTDNYKITGVYDPQDLQVKVTEQANQMTPVVRPLFTVATIEGKPVVSAEISECDTFDKPCYYKGAGKMRGSYVRVGEADLPMTEYEIYSYDAFKRKVQDELRDVPAGMGSELDQSELGVYLAKLRREKQNLSQFDDEQVMKLGGLSAGGQPTLAGLLLFGKYPQASFPGLCVTAVVVPGQEIGMVAEDESRFLDNKRIEGTIPQMLDRTLNFIHRNIRVKTIIDDTGKRADKAEYPIKAVREILLNALIHRDYSLFTESSPVRVLLYSNRLEVENPGGLYGRLTLDSLGKVGADTRNPAIASALEILIDTENRFSGIPTIRYEMEKAKLPPPVFSSERGVFKVTLYNADAEIFEDNDLPLPERILQFCKEPKTRDEIAKTFGFSAISYMMTKYVQPMLDDNKLKMTLPDKPKSKNQRYFTIKFAENQSE